MGLPDRVGAFALNAASFQIKFPPCRYTRNRIYAHVCRFVGMGRTVKIWSSRQKKVNVPTVVLEDEYDEEEHFDYLMERLLSRPDVGAPVDVPAVKMTLEEFRSYANLDSTAVLNYWFTKGCPRELDGRLYVPSVVDWAVANKLPKGAPPLGVLNQSEYVSPKDFARFLGVDHKKITGMYRLGLPCAYNGWIHFDEGKSWAEKSKSKSTSVIQAPDPEEYETRTLFAKRCGVHFASVSRWIKAGLPCLPNGNIHIRDGLEWVKTSRRSGGRPLGS